MSDQEPSDWMFFPSQDQESDGKWPTGSSGINNYNVPPSIIIPGHPLSLWRSPPFPSTPLQEAHEAVAAADYSYILNDLSTAFEEVPSSLALQQSNPGENWITGSRALIQNELSSGVSIEDQMVHESVRYSTNYTLTDLSNIGVINPWELIPLSEENILHGLTDKGQSSAGTKRKLPSNSLEMQTEESELQEDGAKEESKQQKRTHHAEVHNLNNRLRRQKFKEKLKALQELIPRCNKRDKESTLNDAINYIKILQNQVQEQQTGSSGTGFPMSLFPWMMPPQPGMQQIPTFPKFLHTFPRTEYGMGMGMGMSYPMGLPSPSLMGSASSGLSASGIQNAGNVMEPWIGTSNPCSGSQFTTQGETSPSENGHNKRS